MGVKLGILLGAVLLWRCELVRDLALFPTPVSPVSRWAAVLLCLELIIGGGGCQAIGQFWAEPAAQEAAHYVPGGLSPGVLGSPRRSPLSPVRSRLSLSGRCPGLRAAHCVPGVPCPVLPSARALSPVLPCPAEP